MNGKPYTEEFRITIIRLHLDNKRTLTSLSEEYGVSVNTISRWIIIYRNKN